MRTLLGKTAIAGPGWWLKAFRALRKTAWLIPVLWFSHGTTAQAQACTQVPVLNHPTYQLYRTNGASGSCTLPSGIVMGWNHVGANRGLTSFGCPSYDPTYWMDGGTMTVTFSQPVNNVGFIVWGLDGGDAANVTVGSSGSQAAPQTFNNEFTDLCTGHTSGTPPTVSGNTIQSTGAYFGQIGVRASNASAYTVIQLAVTANGGGFGLVGVGSPVPIGPGGPPTSSSLTPIPTLSEWGMIALAALMAFGGVWAARRRRA